MAATVEDLAKAAELRRKARELRSACSTLGNRLAGTVESCAAAADGMEALAARLEAGPTRADRTVADVVAAKIGDPKVVAGRTSLSDLAEDIAKDVGTAGVGLGVGAVVVGIAWIVAQFLRRPR